MKSKHGKEFLIYDLDERMYVAHTHPRAFGTELRNIFAASTAPKAPRGYLFMSWRSARTQYSSPFYRDYRYRYKTALLSHVAMVQHVQQAIKREETIPAHCLTGRKSPWQKTCSAYNSRTHPACLAYSSSR